MIAAALAAAVAVLLWPGRRARRSQRVARLGHPYGSRIPGRARPGEWRTPLVAVASATAVAAVASTPLVALLTGVVGLVAARSWEAARRDRAEERRLDGLAEGLGALAAELRSGRPLAAATTAAVAACGHEDSGRALAGAVRVRRDSAPSAVPEGDDAVGAAVDRLSAAVLLSTRTGCSLADVVGAVDDDLRARRRHRQDLRSATAGPRASAMLLAGLPVLGLAMGSGVGADPWQVLTGTGTGQVLLVAGVTLELAGLVWSRRLVAQALR